MPELPEVEFAARRLRAWAIGRAIARVDAEPGRPLCDVEPDVLDAALAGRAVTAVRRHGKQLFIDFDDGHVLTSHLGMTGKWLRLPEHAPPREGTRLQIVLDDGHRLDHIDPRRLGRLRLLARGERHPELDRLGPDALEACARPGALAEAVGWSRREIKVALMDQESLAGVGNIYAAEALHAAGISPFRPAADLKPAEFERLAAAIVDAMQQSLARERDDEIRYLQDRDATNPFRVYGRTDAPCPTCGVAIIRAVQQGRSTFYCPVCQPD